MNIFSWARTSAFARILLTGFLVLILLIPVAMITGLIDERTRRRDEAVQEVAQRWGKSQALLGPLLVVTVPAGTKKRPERTRAVYFLPATLDISGKARTRTLHRGIFEVPLYEVDLKVRGSFDAESIARARRLARVPGASARLDIGLGDVRGLKGAADLRWNKSKLRIRQGLGPHSLGSSGIHARQGLRRLLAASSTASFQLNVALQGTRRLSFAPVGKQTTVKLSAPWSDPAFDGRFVPDTRTVSSQGFAATWKIAHFARDFPQTWSSTSHRARHNRSAVSKSQTGVSLLVPVDVYHRTTRAVKYAALFIALTFLTLFLFELLGNASVHPIQYLFVGTALCLFYLLLLALAEHVGFGAAYAIATAGCIGLVTLYSLSVLRKTMRALGMAAVLTGLYGYLYALLQLQDYALVIGALALFAVLAAVMFITRNIDWYGLQLRTNNAGDATTGGGPGAVQGET